MGGIQNLRLLKMGLFIHFLARLNIETQSKSYFLPSRFGNTLISELKLCKEYNTTSSGLMQYKSSIK